MKMVGEEFLVSDYAGLFGRTIKLIGSDWEYLSAKMAEHEIIIKATLSFVVAYAVSAGLCNLSIILNRRHRGNDTF